MATLTRRPTSPSVLLDPNAQRGAENLIHSYLGLTRGNTLRLWSHGADDVVAVVERVLNRADIRCLRTAIDTFTNEAQVQFQALLTSGMLGVDASLLIAGPGLPHGLSVATARIAEAAKIRHLHFLSADVRTLSQSLRAEPELLDTINSRIADRLKDGGRLRIASETGTSLNVDLRVLYPIVKANGRVAPGQSENVPSGYVCFHPANVEGIFVADRQVAGTGVEFAESNCRRSPARVRFVAGRVADVKCEDPTMLAAIRGYLALHPDAGRVGILTLPTNYLYRAETGLEMQDAMLPGAMLLLGYTHTRSTRAAYDVPVQLRLLGRKQDVWFGDELLVEKGRLSDALVAGMDPFR